MASRIIDELNNKLSHSPIRYDRDILMTALCLVDNYLETISSGPLKLNLITFKYVLSLKFFDITFESANRGFDFKNICMCFRKLFQR